MYKKMDHEQEHEQLNIPASYSSMKSNNELFFFRCKTIMLEIRS